MSYLEDKRILLTVAAGGFGTVFVRRLLEKGTFIKGIENRKPHVYPGFFAKAAWHLARFHPVVGKQPVVK